MTENVIAKKNSGCCSHDKKEAASDKSWYQNPQIRMPLLCGLALGLAYLVGYLIPSLGNWAFLAALSVGLIPIICRAFSSMKQGNFFTIEILMSIAATGAFFIGASQEAAVVVLLFLVGEMLEGLAARKANASIKELATLIPKTAFLEENDTVREVQAEELVINSIILVRPGDRIAADGVIVEGDSAINEAPVTGESVPKQKKQGDDVFAGTINGDGVLRVKVTAAASDNTIARIIKLVEEAQDSKAPTERFIERFSKYYTPCILLLGLLVSILPPLLTGASWNEWIYKGLAVLLIGCPCALVISTPAAIASGLSAGARRGLLMKGGAVLENLRLVTHVALDKTGTITEGKPVVTDIIGLELPSDEVLSLAAAIETGSSHPLAVAIIAKAKEATIEIPSATDSKAIAGKGVSGVVKGSTVYLMSPKAAQEIVSLEKEQLSKIEALNDEGKTVSVVMVGKSIAGFLAIRDEPRKDARKGLAILKDAGIVTIMLTGDNQRTAEAIGKSMGITEIHAHMMPQDKQAIVQKLQSSGAVVAKIGDGINDAPALAAADIGIAMGGGTDVALETADAAILHGRVTDIANMIFLSKKVVGNIWQNITISLGLKLVFLVTTIMGVTGLWPAILADTGATVLVTANAMRLLNWKGTHSGT
ncbi:MAG: cadmium-translocating P-type ATPase [Micavibrio aeruginosavorus]|uniref:P-type Zn(2+) transporter n=1 Tax=Micavibrio aeruginosavorus TaxID=349221 RepID=A0A2W5FGV4_9BACT|nr:MAG: cadmium-translocating P-type ATPase [Micavibrio aeruginosavorus]